MKFSVIMPCHNAGRWIREALRSVAAQTIPAHEVIVIDDSSTDDSLAEVQASGVDTVLLRSTHRNAAATRNSGIDAATGDWIALLDADDRWYPNHLQRAQTMLEESGDVAFLANHDWMNVRGETIPIPAGFSIPFTAPLAGNSADAFVTILAGGLHFGHSTVVYRRERVLEVGCFDALQRRRHDIDLWLRVIHGHRWSYDSEKSAAYREDTPGSLSKDEPACEYYYLRALLKNQAGYDTPTMRELIAVSARRAMSLSFVDAPAQDYRRTRELAWARIRPSFRLFYACAGLCPALARSLLRMKRRLRKRQAG